MAEHNRFMKKALELAQAALEAGEFPVGCVMVAADQIVASGQRTNSQGQVNEIDHAEMVALRQLLGQRPDISPAAVTVYATLEPCLMCYSTMLISGISHYVYAYEDAMGGGTKLDLQQLPPLYQALRPTVIPHVQRQQSLALFKEFFNKAASNYLSDTYLARYTLEQE